MLIRFLVENFLSFGVETEFSMVAGKAQHHPHHLTKLNKPSNLKLLKAGVIYGANASGKSNLVKAIAYARDRILQGTRPKQLIPFTPFRFDKENLSKPSKFTFEFSTGDTSYNYGFSLGAQRIYEEWLYELTATSERQIFERTTSANDDVDVDFNIKFDSKDDENFLRFVARGTRPNQLFLTESIERNVERFADVYNWFRSSLVIVFPDSRAKNLWVELLLEPDFKQRFEKLLKQFDTGIFGIELQPIDVDTNSVPSVIDLGLQTRTTGKHFVVASTPELPHAVEYLLSEGIDGKLHLQSWKIKTVHQGENDGNIEYLEVGEESDGTQRLFDIIPLLIEMMDGEKVFIVDELDRSLHPHLSRNILELFLNADTKSQLIVTTHESSLLDLNLLRRDEIWFIEKDKHGKSSAYSLEEYAPRHDMDIRKGYLLGRYGAIPFLNTNIASEWASEHVETEI